MGPSIAGRGKPRPLLAGVFRKACDYCVRSKRGCNGGTPCEQCIRRGHSCTYSQRRKSGPRSPRSRPLRPQQQQHSPARLGTRSSARRTVVSPAPSPARTASVSSSSSSSSPGETTDDGEGDDSSDDEFGMQEQRQQREQKQKRCRISGPEEAGGEGGAVPHGSPVPVSRRAEDHPALPSPFISSKAGTREGGAAADAAAAAAAAADAAAGSAEHDLKPQASMVAVSSPSSLSPPRQLSPLTVGAPPPLPLHLQRSSSLPSWAREASGDVQQQQTHLSSSSVGAMPASITTTTTRGDMSAERVNQITMQRWEGGRQRSVTLINMATQQQQQRQQQQAQAFQVPAFAVPTARVFVSDPLGLQTQQQQTAAAATASLAASMMLDGGGDFAGGGALKDLDEDDDLTCCPWKIPSLTRQGSLARVVAALGAERSGVVQQGVEIGFEGSFSTAW